MRDSTLIAGLSLGILFLCSGLLKVRDWRAFLVGVVEYEVLPVPLARVAARSLPLFEIGLGLSLLSGRAARVTGVIAALLILSFAWAVGLSLARGRSLACHCFGSHSDERLGYGSLARIVVMFGLALTSISAHPTLDASPRADVVAAFVIAGSLDVLLFLFPNLAAPVRIWTIKAGPAANMRQGCISLRNHPLPEQTTLAAGNGNVAS